MESMQQSQAQQLKLMEGLLGSFNRYMDRKFKKDIYSLNKRTV